MRKTRKTCRGKRVFQLLVLFMVSVWAVSPVMAETITIVSDSWCPYICDPNSAEPGYGIDIATQIFEAAGHTIEFKLVPWTRAIQSTREGTYHAIVGALKEDAPDFIFPEEELGMTQIAFFAKTGSLWRFEGTDSLTTVRSGVIREYSYGEELDTFFQAHQHVVDYVSGNDPYVKNIKKLLAGRVDIIVEEPNVLYYKAKQLGVTDQIVSVGHFGIREKIYLAFSPAITQSNEYASIFTTGLRTLQDSGELEDILTKYGLEDWK